jgi:hypothetical protein
MVPVADRPFFPFVFRVPLIARLSRKESLSGQFKCIMAYRRFFLGFFSMGAISNVVVAEIRARKY